MRCPKCGSTAVESNKICHNGSGGHAAHTTTHSAMHGHPIGAAIAGGLWLAAKAVDQFTNDHLCKRCHHTF